MKHDFTDILKDKLQQGSIPEPDGLWDAIASDLDKAVAAPVKPRRVRPAVLAAAAGVAALLVAAIFWLIPSGETSLAVPQPPLISEAHAEEPIKAPDPAIGTEKSATPLPHKANRATAHAAPMIATETEEPTHAQSEPTECAEEATSIEIVPTPTEQPEQREQSSTIDQQPSANTQKDTRHTAPAEPIAPKRRQAPGLSIGLYASNLPTTRSDNDYVYMVPSPAGDPNEGEPPSTLEDDDDAKQSKILKARKPRSEGSRHQQPVRFGASLRLPITSSLSLSTGVTFSYHSSDVSITIGDMALASTEQNLWYVGVPLSLEYRLASYRRLSVYLTAGGMAEKCIYGRWRGLEGGIDAMDHRLQFSANAGAGLQLDLIPRLGIFIEPLATYYFDNGSDIDNIYKSRPLNLDLRIGLRYTLPHR